MSVAFLYSLSYTITSYSLLSVSHILSYSIFYFYFVKNSAMEATGDQNGGNSEDLTGQSVPSNFTHNLFNPDPNPNSKPQIHNTNYNNTCIRKIMPV